MTIVNITVVQGVALQPGPKGDPGEQGPPGAIATLDVQRGWSSLQYQVPQVVTYAVAGTTTWAVDAAPNATMQIGAGNTTMGAPTGVVDGAFYTMRTVQDATAPRTFTWNTKYHWPGGAAAALQPTNSVGAIDLWVFRGAASGVLEFCGAQFDVKA